MNRVNALILVIGFIVSGCASVGMNSMCGHVQGNEVTIPYVGGKADGDVIACHIGCFGMNCPKPDYAALATITAAYSQQQNGKMSIPGPGTLTYTPSK
jgi:hypothetical protein